MSQPDSQAELGLTLGGREVAPVQLPQPGQMGVPPYPGQTIMPPAVVPRPPKLPDELESLGRVELAERMTKCYRGAVEARYKVRCFTLTKRSDLTGNGGKWVKMLHSAAVELHSLGIAPASWAAFSVDGWRRTEPLGPRKPPPLNWVFSVGRITERFDWWQNEQGGYCGGRVIYGSAAQDMMRRYALMQRDLIWARPKNEGDVKAVVDKHFPNGLYDRLLQQAKAQALDDQAQMDAALKRGEWLGW